MTDGRGRRWARHNHERRRQVVDAAVEVIGTLGPGVDFNVAQIAERAGINRSVLYRHFEDRAELGVAVQREICARANAAVLPAISLDGTPREIVHRIVGTYVRWAVDHSALLHYVEQEILGAAAKPLEEAITEVADSVEQLIEPLATVLCIDLAQKDRALIRPFVFGLIGGAMQSVRQWLTGAPPTPDVDHFAEFVGQTVWFQIEGLAISRGVHVPDLNAEELLATWANSAG